MTLKVLLASTALALTTVAAQAEPLRVRGTVTALDAAAITVENAAGQTTEVTLTEPVVLMYRDIALSDVAENAYVAVPSIPAAGGQRRALGLVVFPEAMRGMDEGFKSWDLTPESGMTNASVAQIVARGGENVLTVSYGDEKQTIFVPSTAPVTTFAPAPDEEIEVGDNVVIFADSKDGSITGKFIGVHENGGLPPL